MKEESEKLFAKADRAVRSAEILLREGEQDFSAGRAYYAMFYAAEALLNEKDLRFRKHAGVHGAFGEHFAKTSEMDPKYHRWLLNAFDRRREGDYGTDFSMNEEEVVELISQAKEFIVACRDYLSSQS